MTSEIVHALIARACRLLAKREYSAHELLRKLLEKARREDCEEAMRQLIDQGAQSDQRFAESLCRSRFSAGKGPDRLRHELRNHHIEENLIETSMQPYANEWAALAEKVRKKKYGADLPASYPELAKQLRFLKQRGFSHSELSQYAPLSF